MLSLDSFMSIPLLRWVGLVAWVGLAGAQSSVPSVNRLHAIVGAKIEIGDGRTIERGNVVLRAGLIVAVGADAAVPPGAEVFDGKGLTVYPGFIDGYTTKGLKLPDPNPKQDDDPPRGDYGSAAMRTANRKGVRPEIQARQYLALNDEFVNPYRSAGFTTVMIAPGGGFLNGLGTLVNLSGRPVRESVVAPLTTEAIALSATGVSGNDYPWSLLGQVAQVRQALLDAQWHRWLLNAFAVGGSQRPPSDPTLEALMPLLDQVYAATFEADTAPQIDRSFALAQEFGLKPILVGGLQAYRRIGRIQAMRAPVVLSLNFGKAPKAPDKAEEKKTPDDPGDQDEIQIEEGPERLAERTRLYEQTVRNADALRQAGISFAFTTQGSKDAKEMMASLRSAVKLGLPRDVALKALTANAASIYHVERYLGSIEPGKVANLTLMTGDFLDEKTKVKLQYIDGYRIEGEKKEAGK